MSDVADAQVVLPFSPNTLKYVFCDILDGIADVSSQFQKHLWRWRRVDIVLNKPPKGRNHDVRSGDWGGHVHMLSAADAGPIQQPCRFPLRYSRTPISQCGGALSSWKMKMSSSVSYGINKCCNTFRYICPITLFSTKKNGPNTGLLERAQNMFTLGLSGSISTTVMGFSDPHIWIFCLSTLPDK
jgi:hypothetical protein